MFTSLDFKVEIMNPELVKEMIDNQGEFSAICYNSNVKYKSKIGESVLSDGHMSGSRGDYIKFHIEVVPRYTVDQAVRSEQGVYKNVQSQRYCDMSDIDIYVNSIVANDDYLVDEILEHEQQTAVRYLRMKEYMKETYPKMNEEQINDSIRTILPIGQKTKFNIGFDIEGLIHFMNVRLCSRADYPIRMLAMKMKELVLELEPRYAEYLVPKCEAMLFCNEKHGCGKYPSKKELLGVLDKVID